MEEMNEEQSQLLTKVLQMLGKNINEFENVSVGINGGIILETGKLNTEKFVKMAMNA